MALTSERCEACQPGSPTVTEAEIQELTPQIPDWEITEVKGVPRLKRVYKVDGWMPAVRLTNAIAALAEEEDHHPSILVEWGKVTVSWWTHAIKGLHRNDFIMAAKTDQAFAAHEAAEAGPAH
ncbi:MAG TPA: 4a-hydroxytetrahydrobiopterin dehydratase [Thermomicrobiales bacterium]|nr:4a-hydroxytetrahydrobiopterin dehydratase [Thermomicrobiales bacterium]